MSVKFATEVERFLYETLVSIKKHTQGKRQETLKKVHSLAQEGVQRMLDLSEGPADCPKCGSAIVGKFPKQDSKRIICVNPRCDWIGEPQ